MGMNSQGSLKQVAPSNRVRDDWLWALRLLLVHMNSQGSLKQAGMFTAEEVLTSKYDTLEFSLHRGANGLRILMDSATNQIVELEGDGSAFASGLKADDVV